MQFCYKHATTMRRGPFITGFRCKAKNELKVCDCSIKLFVSFKTGSLPAHNSPYRLYIIIVVILLYWINSHVVVFVCWFRLTAPTSSLDHTYRHTSEQSDQQNNEDYHSCKNSCQQKKECGALHTCIYS